MRFVAPVVLAVAAIVGAARPAHAQLVTYHVEGDAETSAADPRVAALDAAFAAAVRQALAELVPAAEQKARKADLEREVYARSRIWVASFKVTADVVDGDRRKLEVDVKIARDKLRARLAELAIALEPDTADPAPVVAPGQSRTATILLAVSTPSGVVASYGAAAELDVPGLASLIAALRATGWQYIAAPASGPPAHAGVLEDRSGRALADGVNADLAVIVGIDAGPPELVRGANEKAALARARVRVIDRAGGLVGQGAAVGAAHGGGDEVLAAAIASAAADAFADARPAGATPAAGPVVALVADPDETLVRVMARSRSEAPPWSMVRHIRDRLASLKDVQVSYRRLTAREVVIGVRGTIKPEKLAREIRDLERKITDTSFQTKVDGNQVEVRVSGSP
jgi:hypothetical protein